jgi:hypothetical protein
MILQRASDSYQKESIEFKTNEDGSAYVIFLHFGKGSERTSDFIAFFGWEDVEALAKAFAENGNKSAKRYAHAMNVASAIEFFSKNSN